MNMKEKEELMWKAGRGNVLLQKSGNIMTFTKKLFIIDGKSGRAGTDKENGK